jgi:predicted negative regulator of RcsB-dependent stress response
MKESFRMKINKLITIAILSILILSGCRYFSDEVITEKFIETEKYYKKGKLYTENIYMIQTDKRLYKVEKTNSEPPDDIYYSYNIGDKVVFYDEQTYRIILNDRSE